MPLMYVILKDADANIEEASRRIEEGKSTDRFIALLAKLHLIRVIPKLVIVLNGECLSIWFKPGQYVVNEYSRQHNLNIYDGGELRNTTRQCGW